MAFGAKTAVDRHRKRKELLACDLIGVLVGKILAFLRILKRPHVRTAVLDAVLAVFAPKTTSVLDHVLRLSANHGDIGLHVLLWARHENLDISATVPSVLHVLPVPGLPSRIQRKLLEHLLHRSGDEIVSVNSGCTDQRSTSREVDVDVVPGDAYKALHLDKGSILCTQTQGMATRQGPYLGQSREPGGPKHREHQPYPLSAPKRRELWSHSDLGTTPPGKPGCPKHREQASFPRHSNGMRPDLVVIQTTTPGPSFEGGLTIS
jgi:hypothetical protein